ncbi:TetR/AcrR family transcriptional regulator [Desulfosporosinus nitroreducens]|uniref:TetR/AcrR family transcriptional regulator n=1 Tax=Desulfosporosinus nitroreducens TaxID=2018668 RepID=A0ABT8QW90_9FIRM|nr:TetR/AcrR family transcriptional regulator [Desulfosporosinus nitroreducens]MCO1604121.1 TetR/AcrR family transcriptional regulator [Desulfosporosinus nitroreducens]MDO0825152.1 TetR/AcrR family transcriptional regulator [Desulfosporosinus nitroreducens]
MDGFEKRRNDKKAIILQTALELFGKYGFEKVTVTEIAEKAHVSKVSIYNFFESKDNLRRIIVKNILDESLNETKALVEKECSFIDKMREYLENRIIYENRYNMDFFFEAVESDPVLRQYLDDFNIENKRLISCLIKEGKKIGYFSADISDTAIEIYIDIFYHYFLHNRKIRPTLEQNPKLAEEINLLFLNGLIRHREQ